MPIISPLIPLTVSRICRCFQARPGLWSQRRKVPSCQKRNHWR